MPESKIYQSSRGTSPRSIPVVAIGPSSDLVLLEILTGVRDPEVEPSSVAAA